MQTAADIIAFVERATGHPLHSDEGVQRGPAGRSVERAFVCWMATKEALSRAAKTAADLVIGHESLYYPYDAVVRKDLAPGWQDWPVNHARRTLLEDHGMTFARLHGSLDEICIFDEFAARLGLEQPVIAEGGLAKVYAIKPCTLGELVERVARCMTMSPLRVSAPNGLGQKVSRVGLPWGGLGLFVNVGYQQHLLSLGCDVLIAGESDSYGFRFSAECGVPMIETSHEDSENDGLRRFCELLRERFPALSVEFFEVSRPWCWT
jgi:putative NIF3 family GTP cyclohydrolase 1 type 2